jgi:hypothetical protein
MSKLVRNTLLFAVSFFCLVSLQQQLYGQALRNAPQPSELRNLTRRSGAIFAGRVLAVQLLQPRFGGEVPTVRVTFRVERGIRGPRTGTQFVLRQWAALWNSGQRYSVGERVLLFLYPASKVGLTSAVGGERGRFRIDPKGQLVVNAERAKLFDDAQLQISMRPRIPRTRIPIRDVHRMIRFLEAGED